MTKLHSQIPCKCPEIDGFRVPKCTCSFPKVSPFLQIRWKRLVIDEGHVSSTLSTALVPFAKLMSVERRWIITGTPTTNLLGLSLGNSQVKESIMEDDCMAVDGGTDDESDKTSFLGSSRVTPGPDETPSVMTAPSSPASSVSAKELEELDDTIKTEEHGRGRLWTKYDREDLHKLGNMIGHFIAVPQFSADQKLITTHVVDPLLDRNGPRFGATKVLSQVMEMVMIRHR